MAGVRLTRRTILKAAAAAGILGPWAGRTAATAAAGAAGRDRILAYLKSLARPDGGYGWSDQPDSHLVPTFAALGSYHALGCEPPNKDAAAAYVRANHPLRGKQAETKNHAANLRTFVFQQVQSLRWLGADARDFAAEVRGWTKPSTYPPYYEKSGFPIFRQEMMVWACREALGLPMDDVSPDLVAYLDSRRRPDGSFNNTPADDGSPGNVLNTWWGLAALRLLGRIDEKRAETVAWLRACQLPCGGFTYRPGADVGGIDDGEYAWAAVRALAALGAAPADTAACRRYLESLWNEDGGFAPRPGLPSDPMATYQALDALAALGAIKNIDTCTPARRPAAAPLPDGLRVFTVQIEAPGQGSPSVAVDLARAFGIHLWGAKNAKPEWIARAQAIARARQVPVTFFASNEEYGTYIRLPGLGNYSHGADVMAPAGADFGPPMAGKDADWTQFREGRLKPLEAAGGRLFWQICDNEEYARILLDDSVARGGHAAISTFHFGCWNMAYTLPFVFRYRHQLPMVALQDSHAAEPWWWADQLLGYRTLFLAREPTWEGWLEALRRQWVVAVRHDAVTRFATRMMGGGPGVREFVRQREADWRWWGDRPDDLRRPWVSVTAVRPGDPFEAVAPKQGVSLCVRAWWEATVQGKPKKPLVEIESVSVDGRTVAATSRTIKDPKGILLDAYHEVALPDAAPGRHAVAVGSRRIADGTRRTETFEFTVP